MTKAHYSEADLLEMHYLKPCMNTAMLEHVENCAECRTKMQRLEEKLRSVACETPDKPESFWAQQRASIARRTQQTPRWSGSIARTLRVAAAAVLAFFLGGVLVYRALEPRLTTTPDARTATASVTAAAQKPADELQLTRDPWQSDELNDFHSVVSWETWIDNNSNRGQL